MAVWPYDHISLDMCGTPWDMSLGVVGWSQRNHYSGLGPIEFNIASSVGEGGPQLINFAIFQVNIPLWINTYILKILGQQFLRGLLSLPFSGTYFLSFRSKHFKLLEIYTCAIFCQCAQEATLNNVLQSSSL